MSEKKCPNVDCVACRENCPHKRDTLFPENVIKAKICPYCEKIPKLVDSSIIYGKSYGMVYFCKVCDAYVGCHPGKKNKPLGRLANRKLRGAKKQAHFYFDKIWKESGLTRKQAYSWLSKSLGIPEKYTHIGMFTEELCFKTVELSKEYLKEKECI